MKKILFLLALSVCSILNCNATSETPVVNNLNGECLYDTKMTETILILDIKLDEYSFKFNVYEKEMLDEHVVCLYGKSPFKNLNRIVVSPKDITIYAGNKIIKILDNRLYDQIEEYIYDIPNIIKK